MTTDLLPVDHIKVEMALTTTPDDPAPVWVDITQWVDLIAGISITQGRADEYAEVQTGTLRATLNNSDGRFTAGNTASPYYPNIKVRKKLRVSYQNPSGPGPISYRHTGYLEEPSTEWPGGKAYSAAPIGTSDRFKRLGKANPLRALITHEYLTDLPALDYTLGEPTGSTTAGDTSKNGGATLATVQVGAGGTLVFGANTGPGTDGMPAPAFTPANELNGKCLAGTCPALDPLVGLSVEAFFLTSLTTVERRIIVRLLTTSGHYMDLAVSTTGKVTVTDTSTDFTLTSAASFNDGLTHHVGFTRSVSAGLTTVEIVVDGVSCGSSTFASSWAYGSFTSINIGGGAIGGGMFNGALSHVAAYNSALSLARLASHHEAGSTRFVGERSDQRIARLATYAGVPVAEQSLEVGLSTSIAFVDTTGLAPLAAMQDVAATENGILFIDGAGVLTFHARSHRYNTISTFTIDVANIDPSARFVTNDLLLVNDVTAGRAGGVTFRAVNAASVLDYGTTAVNLTLLTTSDNEVADAANWKANQSSAINPRLPNLVVDLLTSPELHAAAMLLTIGSRITTTGWPSQAHASSVDLFIEGWTETISRTAWVLAWNTSPAAASSVWQLDSPIYSQLDVSTRLAY